MTAQPHDSVPGSTPDAAKSLRAIRAALVVPQDREAFDAGLKAVLDEVRVNLDLGVLSDFMHRWWISACNSARDPRRPSTAKRAASDRLLLTLPSRTASETQMRETQPGAAALSVRSPVGCLIAPGFHRRK
ncbi:MAG: DUF6247 family protein [Actinoallomurus sp.]